MKCCYIVQRVLAEIMFPLGLCLHFSFSWFFFLSASSASYRIVLLIIMLPASRAPSDKHFQLSLMLLSFGVTFPCVQLALLAPSSFFSILSYFSFLSLVAFSFFFSNFVQSSFKRYFALTYTAALTALVMQVAPFL